MLSGFGVVVSSGITLVIFFPRSIENEIAAQDAGIRSRGFFGSRNHLTFVSQEQELYGTYDPEDAPGDSKAASPSSLYHNPAALPSSMPFRGTAQSPLPLVHAPPTPPPPLPPKEPIRLIPNRRRPSVDNHPSPLAAMPSLNSMDRFDNPATNISRPKTSFRSPVDLGGGARR